MTAANEYPNNAWECPEYAGYLEEIKEERATLRVEAKEERRCMRKAVSPCITLIAMILIGIGALTNGGPWSLNAFANNAWFVIGGCLVAFSVFMFLFSFVPESEGMYPCASSYEEWKRKREMKKLGLAEVPVCGVQ